MSNLPAHFPRAPRYSVMLMATTERLGRQATTEHRVSNLSEDGVCVQRGGIFRAGETLILTVGNLMAVGAQVQWVLNGCAGMQFTQSISIDDALGKAARPPKMTKPSLTFPHDEMADSIG